MAQLFENKNGEVYSISIDALAVERVEQQLGIDLFSLEDLAQACSGIGSQVRLIHLLSDSQEPVEEFSRGLNGDNLVKAQEALSAELLAFLPTTQADVMRKAIEQVRQTSAGILSVLREKLSDHLQSA